MIRNKREGSGMRAVRMVVTDYNAPFLCIDKAYMLKHSILYDYESD